MQTQTEGTADTQLAVLQYSGCCTDQIANLAKTHILSSASMKKIAEPTPCVKPVY